MPTVEYQIHLTDGTVELLESPAKLPDPGTIAKIEEPYVKARIMAPAEYIGPIMTLGMERRGVYKNTRFLDTVRVELDWEFPLGEIILDFFDKMKTVSRGYASLDYEMLEYRSSDLVRLDMLINGDGGFASPCSWVVWWVNPAFSPDPRKRLSASASSSNAS